MAGLDRWRRAEDERAAERAEDERAEDERAVGAGAEEA